MPIHVWDGERIEGCQAAGRTHPLFVAAVIRGPEGEVSERREFLVKAMGLPEISRTGLFAEFFGTQLAGEFGIDVPAPVIVNLSPDLLAVASENFRAWGVTPEPGYAVGVAVLRGLAPLSRLVPPEGLGRTGRCAANLCFRHVGPESRSTSR